MRREGEKNAGKENGAWKYCYWMDGSALAELQRELANHNIAMTRAEKNPCEALRARPDTQSGNLAGYLQARRGAMVPCFTTCGGNAGGHFIPARQTV